MKYMVSYTSGATGYGWERKCETVEEVKYLIDEIRYINSAMVTVWDMNWNGFVFYKNCGSDKPETDYIYNHRADLRTKNKLAKK